MSTIPNGGQVMPTISKIIFTGAAALALSLGMLACSVKTGDTGGQMRGADSGFTPAFGPTATSQLPTRALDSSPYLLPPRQRIIYGTPESLGNPIMAGHNTALTRRYQVASNGTEFCPDCEVVEAPAGTYEVVRVDGECIRHHGNSLVYIGSRHTRVILADDRQPVVLEGCVLRGPLP